MLPSVSSLPRVVECPESENITHVYDAGNVYATRGNVTHAFMLNLIQLGAKPALELVPEEDPARRLCENVAEHEASIPRGGECEVALAWDVFTGKARILGLNIERAYLEHGLKVTEFPGSADYIVKQGRTVIVLDWKTGFRAGKAKTSWQMKALGLAAARAYDCDRAIVVHVYLREDGEPVFDEVVIEAYEFVAIERKLREIATDYLQPDGTERIRLQVVVAGAPAPTVKEGPWCHYCPAFRNCGAKVRQLRDMHAGLVQLEASPVTAPADVARLVHGLEAAEKLIGRVWARVFEYADRFPLELGDGRRLERAPGRGEDEVVNPALALHLIEQELDPKAADAATTTNKGKLLEAARQYAKEHDPPLPIGKTQDRVLERLRRAGAIKKVIGEEKVRFVKGQLAPPAPVFELPPAAAEAPRAQVVDLMAGLKESLKAPKKKSNSKKKGTGGSS